MPDRNSDIVLFQSHRGNRGTSATKGKALFIFLSGNCQNKDRKYLNMDELDESRYETDMEACVI